MNAIACTVPTTETLIVALADVAGLLRAARADNVPVPVVCAGRCARGRFVPWASGMVCTACGCRPVKAAQLHALLTRALRGVQVQERKAA